MPVATYSNIIYTNLGDTGTNERKHFQLRGVNDIEEMFVLANISGKSKYFTI